MSHKQLSDMELDALIVRSLSRLPTHAPSRVFSDKVMNRVGLPSPRAVVRYRRARAWLAEPRRALALAGAYAIIAIAAMVITVPWLVQHSPAIRFAIDWSTSRAELMARGIAMASARWAITSGIAGLLKAIPVSGRQLWAVGAGVVALYAGCAYGLHALLRTPKASHATVQA